MRSLKEISHDAFYKMENYHQITIDFIQETEQLFNEVPESEDEKTELITNLNCLSYDIGIALEIFNPEFHIEISDLKDILSLIEIRIGYLQSLEFKSNIG